VLLIFGAVTSVMSFWSPMFLCSWLVLLAVRSFLGDTDNKSFPLPNVLSSFRTVSADQRHVASLTCNMTINDVITSPPISAQHHSRASQRRVAKVSWKGTEQTISELELGGVCRGGGCSPFSIWTWDVSYRKILEFNHFNGIEPCMSPRLKAIIT